MARSTRSPGPRSSTTHTDTSFKYTLTNGQVKTKDRHFVTSSRPKVWLGFHLKTATRRFAIWASQHKKKIAAYEV